MKKGDYHERMIGTKLEGLLNSLLQFVAQEEQRYIDRSLLSFDSIIRPSVEERKLKKLIWFMAARVDPESWHT